MIRNILLVGLGGSIGSILRYLCQKWIYSLYPHPFPWGTFAVNLAGCLLIGALFGIGEKTSALSPEWRLLLTTGLCGGFTTFSTFAYENMMLLRSGDLTYFLLYTILSIILGVAGVFGGIALVKLL